MADSWVNSAEILGSDLHLELTRAGSRRTALMAALREAIRDGRLAPDTRLPPYRSLAADLGIARNTVADAYAELVAEGWLTARQGSGTRVASRPAPPSPGRRAARRAHGGQPPLPTGGRRGPRPAPHPVHSLLQGQPDAASFPRAAWLASARRALTAAPNEAFGPGDPRGRPELRRALADYLARARGVRTDPERIVVCSGFAHALRLLGETRLTRPRMAVESYGLAFHRSLLRSAGIRTVPLPLDADGALTDGLADLDGVRAALLTPAHQFPTGGPLHPGRRAAAVAWARESGGLVLEDDYDGEFRYDRRPVGAVQGLDPDRVVYLGSVSKSLSPALRLGWMVLPDHLVDRLLAVKGEREGWTGVLDQLTLADFIESGGYDRHVRRMRQHYRRRRDQLVAALAEHAPHIRVSGIAAGLHAVLELPPGTERSALRAAAWQGLALDGLGGYRHPEATTPRLDGLVVGYATPPEHSFAGALDALCRALPPEQTAA
ncbi:PLP-dependent aminotransferase family protein [Streptomyces malaysiensis subsp. malaysiensis]|uniref:PLP-dependent aminotransferase family protein n=1 Tax=Streptomyces malaysiensis TaxID=92644 RepID=A0ABX6W7D8_STRMQ|nr:MULTISPECIES: PLP-dependent aminotransferase family protein [Streptomyces]QPI57393.1 PLP-dependent aminotransferase family protein [Streptomyces solisilvae]UHH18947.1 PLP-dependent aminotransferase family protein [Streptomyces sp. HNM0561]